MTITPQPGYILTKPFIIKKTFKSPKENIGEDQLSEVIEVGSSVKDDKGELRTTNVKKGDKIYHSYSNKTLEIDFQDYRFVHFTEVHGIYESK